MTAVFQRPVEFLPIIVLLLVFVGSEYGLRHQLPNNTSIFLASLFVTLTVAAVCGKVKPWPASYTDLITVTKHPENGSAARLFVLVHGLDKPRWQPVVKALGSYGDILQLDYPASTLSNVQPELVAERISEKIDRESANYAEVVLIGHSVGALIVRKSLLYAAGAARDATGSCPRRWASKVRRVVLLAGTNRGWDITGRKPLDMSYLKLAAVYAGAWLGRFVGLGSMILATETGAPFVANVRLEWMDWLREQSGHQKQVEVVQVLGDIDDIVSDEDNKDLRVNAGSRVAWLTVRGTGHLDVLDVDPGTTIGSYRQGKLILAATRPFEDVLAQSEEQPLGTDTEIQHIVFILHGIRDLGGWSSQFETALRLRARTTGKVAIVSMRYGYFPMGAFLLRGDRQKFVRWFMDAYTETLARYPCAKTIDFIGHSNGTYLLASALEQYHSLRVRRVVFAGSVVRRDYDWKAVFDRDEVKSVRNYVSADDWVVALFPRLFELYPFRWFNDIGSAGFNGFSVPGELEKSVENVRCLAGQHSAFLTKVDSIVSYVTDASPSPEPASLATCNSYPRLRWVSDWTPWTIWLALIVVVLLVGVRVVSSASQPLWPAVVIYVGFVVWLLNQI